MLCFSSVLALTFPPSLVLSDFTLDSPNDYLEFTAIDSDSGIKEILANSTNLIFTFPVFTEGTNDPLIIIAQEDLVDSPWWIDLSVSDVNGNVAVITLTEERLTSQVPEPATMLLIGTGLAGLIVMRRKLKG
jgi:hypothetical protein